MIETAATLGAMLLPAVTWLAYGYFAGRWERSRPSLSSIMDHHRGRWALSLPGRSALPFDAILIGNIMRSVGFFASTTVLVLLALGAYLGEIQRQGRAAVAAVGPLAPGPNAAGLDVPAQWAEAHVGLLIVMMAVVFLKFVTSLRQYNHLCILWGSISGREAGDDEGLSEELNLAQRIHARAARSFNAGVRGCVMSGAAMTWRIDPLVAVAVSLGAIGLLIQIEFSGSYLKDLQLRGRAPRPPQDTAQKPTQRPEDTP